MKALVTGVAGFIGSHLAERLLADGWDVTGVDCFTDYYPRAYKDRNLAAVTGRAHFAFVEADLASADLAPLVAGADAIFHLAGQAGVRASWGTSFETYVRDNILATQHLLETVKGRPLQRFVYASSGSIYGDVETLPIREDTLPHPVSPYGVTKLAAEHLCHLYRASWDVPTVSLRYFTVYGPRQRPDMAFHKFIRAMLCDQPIPLFGSGEQTRDFTYVADVVEATVRAVDAPPGHAFNVSGGSRVSVNHVIATLEALIGRPARVDRQAWQAGDQQHTWADATAARQHLGFAPKVSVRDGLAAEVEWLRGIL